MVIDSSVLVAIFLNEPAGPVFARVMRQAALARGEPLLYKGRDFAFTDIPPALRA